MEERIEIITYDNFKEFTISVYQFFFVSKMARNLSIINIIIMVVNIFIGEGVEIFLSSLIFNFSIIILPYIKAKQAYCEERIESNKIIIAPNMFYIENEFGKIKLSLNKILSIYEVGSKFILHTDEKSMAVIKFNSFKSNKEKDLFLKYVKKYDIKIINGESMIRFNSFVYLSIVISMILATMILSI